MASQALRLSSTMTLVAQLDEVFDISYTCDVARTLHAGLLSDYGKSCIITQLSGAVEPLVSVLMK